MKSILRRAMRHIEKAFDSGFLVWDEYDQAMLLDEYARRYDEPDDPEYATESSEKAA